MKIPCPGDRVNCHRYTGIAADRRTAKYEDFVATFVAWTLEWAGDESNVEGGPSAIIMRANGTIETIGAIGCTFPDSVYTSDADK